MRSVGNTPSGISPWKVTAALEGGGSGLEENEWNDSLIIFSDLDTGSVEICWG